MQLRAASYVQKCLVDRNYMHHLLRWAQNPMQCCDCLHGVRQCAPQPRPEIGYSNRGQGAGQLSTDDGGIPLY